MKNTIQLIAFMAALLLTLGSTSSFAKTPKATAPETVTAASAPIELITASFHKDFRQAELLYTEAGRSYTKLTFKMNGAILCAYYSGNGDLLAVTHNISSTELPIGLLLQLKRDYSNYWITDLFELVATDRSGYYITLENTSTKLVLRSADGTWETYSRSSKQ